MTRRRHRFAALAALLLAACSSAPTPPNGTAAVTASGGPSAAAATPAGPPPSVGPFADPASAATAVIAAADDGARRTAVLGILAAVGIGVYGSDGTPIVHGAERSEDDFWLYDFELEGLIAGLADHDAIPLAELAEGLAGKGVTAGDAPLDDAALAVAIRDAVSASLADPANRTSLSVLVARELALRASSPVDLGATSSDPISLDPLANLLVAADILLPTQSAAVAHLATAELDRSEDTLVRARPIAAADTAALPVDVAAGGCGQIASQNTVNSWGGGQVAVRLLQGGIRRGMPASEMLHAILLNGLVSARAQWDNPHYRHKNVGATSRFVATYVLRIRPGQTAVNCGLFRAVNISAEGPLVGLPVTWREGSLRRHGQTVCGPATCATTKASGAATLLFEPKVERQPSGLGPEIHENAVVTAEADVLSGLGGDLFSRIPNAPVRKLVRFNVDVSYHRSYRVFVDVYSTLLIKPIQPPIGPSIWKNDLIGTAHLEGTLPANTVHDGDGNAGPPVDGTLNAQTRPPRGVPGTCDTATADSHGVRKTAWMVRDAVIWPPQDTTVSLDVAGQNSVDSYWYVQCPPTGRRIETKNSGNVIWENQMFLAHGFGRYGMEFSGLGPGLWTYRDSDDTWANGGDLATWESQETCQGNCKPGSFLRLILRIEPLPPP